MRHYSFAFGQENMDTSMKRGIWENLESKLEVGEVGTVREVGWIIWIQRDFL
jgi:hypothetical protein